MESNQEKIKYARNRRYVLLRELETLYFDSCQLAEKMNNLREEHPCNEHEKYKQKLYIDSLGYKYQRISNSMNQITCEIRALENQLAGLKNPDLIFSPSDILPWEEVYKSEHHV